MTVKIFRQTIFYQGLAQMTLLMVRVVHKRHIIRFDEIPSFLSNTRTLKSKLIWIIILYQSVKQVILGMRILDPSPSSFVLLKNDRCLKNFRWGTRTPLPIEKVFYERSLSCWSQLNIFDNFFFFNFAVFVLCSF